uniref:Capsid protein n=1 Tax=Nanning Totiv tick virus 3 TaxID=2972354 RepID=A0A9E7V2F7_9VIRU|nr:MAG: capsid protein [Nanning Totiv tick virus 3]
MNFLKSIYNISYKRPRDIKISDGNFSITNTILTTVDYGFNKFSVNSTDRTDFATTGLKANVNYVDSVTDYSGFNKKYINDDGTYNFVAAMAEFATVPFGKKVTREEQQMLLLGTDGADSHDAFILNMLISWYLARMYVDSGCTDGILKVRHAGFSNTHVKQTLWGMPDTTIEHELSAPNTETDELHMVFRSQTNFWQQPYVLRYNAGSPAQTAFYILHCLGRSGQSALNVDIPLSGIDMSQMVLDPVGGVQHFGIDYNSVAWTKPDVMWQWILEYVRLNRVETAFAAAFEVLCTISAQPVGSYHESVFWHSAVPNVNLSVFKPTRARISTNLVGEAYRTDTGTDEFTAESTLHPENFLYNAAVYNYMFWLAVPALAHAASADYQDPFDVFAGGHEYLNVLSSVGAQAAVISALYGKEIPTFSTAAAYVTWDLTALQSPVIDPCYVDGTGTGSQRLHTVPPFVSGSLVIGTPTADLPYIRHLYQRGQYTIPTKPMFEMEDAIQFATVMRAFGYDTVATIRNTTTVVRPYSTAYDTVISPLPFYELSSPGQELIFDDPRRREGRGGNLPDVWTVPDTVVTYTRSLPQLEITQRGKWRDTAVPRVILRKPAAKVSFNVVSGAAYIRKTITMKKEVHRVPDFGLAQIETAPLRPVEATGVVPIQIAPQEEVPADDAE